MVPKRGSRRSPCEPHQADFWSLTRPDLTQKSISMGLLDLKVGVKGIYRQKSAADTVGKHCGDRHYHGTMYPSCAC